MNRLHLRIYEPPAESSEPADESTVTESDRHILPFQPPGRTRIISGRFIAPVERAQVINSNSECPECSKQDIEPLELQDAMISSKSRLPIPGTATIVGFHCNDCGTEWPVYELTSRRNG